MNSFTYLLRFVETPVDIESLPARLCRWGSLLRFSHTLFALPFALSMAVIVSRSYEVTLAQVLWILVCLVSARTAAMGYNRLIDRHLDALNPRTIDRELPQGLLSLHRVRFLILVSSALFLFGSYALGFHCLVLAPFVLGWLFFYSWTKRFTSLSHVALGIALALAPGGVWYALTAELAWMPVWMMLAVVCWVAGFDVLYSCQDTEHDRAQGLHSIPSRLGMATSFRLAKMLHILSVMLLTVLGLVAQLGPIYYLGVLVFGSLLLWQYRLVNPSDLERIEQAFFSQNAWASVIYFCFVLLDAQLTFNA